MSILNKRLDIEIFVIGSMKNEFISFLSDVFKQSFAETFSWGNYNRYQLTLEKKNLWMNLFFICLKNDKNLDIMLDSFKVLEKKSIILYLYNGMEVKKDVKDNVPIESCDEELLRIKTKLYQGVLLDENFNKTSDKIKSYIKDLGSCNHEDLKNNLKLLDTKNEDIIFKIGICQSSIFKKSKLVKKNEVQSSSNLDDMCFKTNFNKNENTEDDKTDILNILQFIVKKHLELSHINDLNNGFLEILPALNKTSINSIKILNDKNDELSMKKEDYDNKRKIGNKIQDILIKSVDWLIILYISFCLYKFLVDYNL